MTIRITSLRAAALLPLAAALSACASAPPLPPMEVSRFQQEGFTPDGPIAIGKPPVAASDQPVEPYEAAVAAELARLGLGPIDGQPSPLVAWVSVSRETLEPLPKGSPVRVGVGGSTGSYGSGVGLGLGFDLSGKPKPQVVTHIQVSIRRRENIQQAVWEARASQSAALGTPEATDEAAAKALARAVFVDFPGENGESYTVKQK